LQFENYCQQLCKKHNKHLYIITGGAYYTGNTIKNGVGVPDSCWKVVLILDSNQTINNVNAQTTTIAVMMPNTNGLKGKK
jgi:DNA/RNA endonuclease G (NUC1)